MSSALARIKKELKEISESKDAGVMAHAVDGAGAHWKGTIQGPVSPAESLVLSSGK
jgi:ubiquitin-protein ligase